MILRIWILVRPLSKSACEAAVAATAYGPLTLAPLPHGTDPDNLPTTRLWYAGLQAETAEILAVRAAVLSVPGTRVFRGCAHGLEDESIGSDDDLLDPDENTRVTRRAAIWIAIRQMSIAGMSAGEEG